MTRTQSDQTSGADESYESILSKVLPSGENNRKRLAFKGVLGTLLFQVLVTTATAQQTSDYCSSGLGAVIYELQGMTLAWALGGIVIAATVGMLLRAIAPWPGASNMGTVMLLGALGGPIMFILFLSFIDVIFGSVGGVDTSVACSPYL